MNAQLAGSAFVLGGDGHLFLTGKRDYVVTGSFSGSRVAGSQASIARLQRSSARYYQRPDATHLTFDPAAGSLSGWSLQSDFNKNSGSIRPNASFWAVSPGFEVNDAGFMMNADRMGGHAALVFLQARRRTGFSRNRQLFVAKWNTWNFAGDPMGDGYFANFYAQLRNYWSISGVAHAGRWVYSDRLTRGGPMMRAPGFTAVRPRASKATSGSRSSGRLDGNYETRPDGSWSGAGGVRVDVPAAAHVQHRNGTDVQRELTASQYVRAVTDADAVAMYGRRYVFGALDQKEFGMETRLNLILSPRMSLQMYLQPLLSVGRYTGFKEAAAAAHLRLRRYGQDTGTISFDAENGAYTVYPGPGGTGTPFVIPNPDFNFTSLRANTVFRWEFKPGSTLYVVWTQQREDETSDGRFAFNQDISRMMRAPGDNVFMVKLSYWFGR